MKNPSLFSILILFFICADALGQADSFDRKLRKADSLWETNDLKAAVLEYDNLLKDSIPVEYQSVVTLRLAEALFQAGRKNDSFKALSAIRNLTFIPDHHILMADELKKRTKGVTLNSHTPPEKISVPIATFYVSELPDARYPRNLSFKDIDGALEAAGSILKEKELPEGIIDIIISGDIHAVSTVKIGPELSGSEKNRIVIRSESPARKSSISGGVILKDWQPVKDAAILKRLPEKSRGKVFFTKLESYGISGPDSLVLGGFSSRRASEISRDQSLPVPELFYKGVPQTMARWPNEKDTIIPLDRFRDKRVLKWADEKELWLHGYWKYLWADAYEKVGSISVKDTTIILAPPVNNYGFGESKWHAVNALCEIDMPGEWCLSAKEGIIWYYLPRDFDPAECVLSFFGPMLNVENCNYLTIKDIDLRYVRGDGMVFRHCNNLSVINCSLQNISGYGMKIIEGRNNLVHSCSIESMGRGGIEILSGNIKELENSGSVIENCTISRLSRIDRTYTPAILLEGVGIRVRNCLFSEIPSSGIRLEGNDMLIELNEFSRCVIESDDQGAIDVFGNPLYRGNIIRHNFFHDIGIPDLHMAAGVRLDDAISGFSIYDNLFARSSNNLFGGIQVHGGKDNFIEGNIMGDCHAAISQSAWGDKRWEASLTAEGHPVSIALSTYDWTSDKWMKRYPALKTLKTGGTDRNYAVNNILINGQSMFLRKSPRFQDLNNRIMNSSTRFMRAGDFRKYAEPWQNIPFDEIGPYRNK